MTRDTSAPYWKWWPDINFNLPSGDVTQDILREWFSQRFEFNFAGNPQIETEAIAKVASYGRQLGILTEAVLEIAGKREGDSLERLEQLAKDIEAIKERHRTDLVHDARRALDTLKRADEAGFGTLLREYKDDV